MTPAQIRLAYFPERDDKGQLIVQMGKGDPPRSEYTRFSDYYKSIGLGDPEYIKRRWVERADERQKRKRDNAYLPE